MRFHALLCWALLAPLAAAAQGDAPAFTQVAQDGPEVEALRDRVASVALPDGFHMAPFAHVPGARSLAVGPQGAVVFVAGAENRVWAVADRNLDRVAEDVKDFAPNVALDGPGAPCFGRDGFLYVPERDRVLAFPAAEFFFDSPTIAAFAAVARGDLAPGAAAAGDAAARACAVGPDGRLYVALGAPDAPEPGALALREAHGVGGVVSMSPDGAAREVHALGLRAPGGLAFDAATGALWLTDAGPDAPGELNRAAGPGAHFGAPWYAGGRVRAPEWLASPPPDDPSFPAAEFAPDDAPAGLAVNAGAMFPERYRGAVFLAHPGPEGGAGRVSVAFADAGGGVTVETFAEGWDGRPTGVAMLRDGSLLIADPAAGALWRVAYRAP